MKRLERASVAVAGKNLRVSLTISVGGGPTRTTQYTVPLEDLASLDLMSVRDGFEKELDRRMRLLLPKHLDTPLF